MLWSSSSSSSSHESGTSRSSPLTDCCSGDEVSGSDSSELSPAEYTLESLLTERCSYLYFGLALLGRGERRGLESGGADRLLREPWTELETGVELDESHERGSLGCLEADGTGVATDLEEADVRVSLGFLEVEEAAPRTGLGNVERRASSTLLVAEAVEPMTHPGTTRERASLGSSKPSDVVME